MSEEILPGLPLRLTGLAGASTANGRTYDGGFWTGGGPVRERHLAVRFFQGAYGEPSSVELDMGDDSHGCTVSLSPYQAEAVAVALRQAADKVRVDVTYWQTMLDTTRYVTEEEYEQARRVFLAVHERRVRQPEANDHRKRLLRLDTGDGRSLPCTQCGTVTPDAMFTDCCGSPMCDNCRAEHEWCANEEDAEAAAPEPEGPDWARGTP